MRKDYIESIKYLFPVVIDDYGNDLWVALINSKKKKGFSDFCGYMVIAKNEETNNTYSTYNTEAFWKVKEKELININEKGFIIQEYKERFHSLEWKPKAILGYQSSKNEELGLVTRFYITKIIQ